VDANESAVSLSSRYIIALNSSTVIAGTGTEVHPTMVD
jgi:hypothetical protein